MIHKSPDSSTRGKDGQMAPRTGFFYNFLRSQVVAKRYDAFKEDFDDVPDEDVTRIRANLRDLDGGLGPYPYDSWKKWISLTNKISSQTISRLEPKSGKIHSVTQLVPETHKSSRSARGCKTKRDYLLPENLNSEETNLDASTDEAENV